MSTEPVPQRLSDAERDVAASMLREHFEAGRLDQTEFEERLSSALSARYAHDLDGLFADLPDPQPSRSGTVEAWSAPPPPWSATGSDAVAPRPAAGLPANAANWVSLGRKLIWPVCIILALVTGSFWPFIVTAIIGSIVLSHLDSGGRKPPPYSTR